MYPAQSKVPSIKDTVRLEIWTKITNTGRNNYFKHKEAALGLAVDRANRYAEIYKYRFNKITIKNQKTRWGSCSKKRNLNFNYRILFLPEEIRDYIVVHEICHLKELNHSRKFWALVAQVFPNHKEIKRELRDKGLSIS